MDALDSTQERREPDPPRRPRDPGATRQNILDVATEEFAEHGLAGARVEAIAARTRTTVRMIYYYFRSKEGLYCAALERAYTAMRAAERGLGLDALPPEEAIARLVRFVFDYHEANLAFNRLVSIENIHRAGHLSGSRDMAAVNATVIETLEGILARGRAAGVFRADADALSVHLLITAFPFFRVANRHTLGVLFGRDPLDPTLREAQRRMSVEAVLGYLRAVRD
ncbi:TetR/AcrR family transcriptional regulator [Roseomonas sp. CCTCC AB2023176]|uniref:TetR/AcrR family transcriptional regulator n=1 Tax=Roseomonas sp. CCTCC AB2023176 TaxID=3342640 RepID=UPI0035E37959